MPPFGGAQLRQVMGQSVESTPRDTAVQRENAGFLAPGQSALNMTGKIGLSNSGATTVALFIVPAGYILCITDVYISHDQTVILDVKLQNGSGQNIAEFPCKGDTAPVEMPGIETQQFWASGQQLNLVYPTSAGGGNGYFNISGFLQAVGAG